MSSKRIIIGGRILGRRRRRRSRWTKRKSREGRGLLGELVQGRAGSGQRGRSRRRPSATKRGKKRIPNQDTDSEFGLSFSRTRIFSKWPLLAMGRRSWCYGSSSLLSLSPLTTEINIIWPLQLPTEPTSFSTMPHH
jgi:hypothetical protein